MSAPQLLTGWHSGKWPGGTYGLRFGKLRETLIEGTPKTINLQLEGKESFTVKLTDGFWKDCPEVRHPEIGPWMNAWGVKVPWPKGNPPAFYVEKLGLNRFAVSGPTNPAGRIRPGFGGPDAIVKMEQKMVRF